MILGLVSLLKLGVPYGIARPFLNPYADIIHNDVIVSNHYFLCLFFCVWHPSFMYAPVWLYFAF